MKIFFEQSDVYKAFQSIKSPSGCRKKYLQLKESLGKQGKEKRLTVREVSEYLGIEPEELRQVLA